MAPISQTPLDTPEVRIHVPSENHQNHLAGRTAADSATGALLGFHPAGAQAAENMVMTIAGSTTCTDTGVVATVDLVKTFVDHVAYYDVVLGEEMQPTNELSPGQSQRLQFVLTQQDFVAQSSRGC